MIAMVLVVIKDGQGGTNLRSAESQWRKQDARLA